MLAEHAPARVARTGTNRRERPVRRPSRPPARPPGRSTSAHTPAPATASGIETATCVAAATMSVCARARKFMSRSSSALGAIPKLRRMTDSPITRRTSARASGVEQSATIRRRGEDHRVQDEPDRRCSDEQRPAARSTSVRRWTTAADMPDSWMYWSASRNGVASAIRPNAFGSIEPGEDEHAREREDLPRAVPRGGPRRATEHRAVELPVLRIGRRRRRPARRSWRRSPSLRGVRGEGGAEVAVEPPEPLKLLDPPDPQEARAVAHLERELVLADMRRAAPRRRGAPSTPAANAGTRSRIFEQSTR